MKGHGGAEVEPAGVAGLGVGHDRDTWLHWAEGAGALATWDSGAGDLDSDPSLFTGQVVSIPPRLAASLGKSNNSSDTHIARLL